SHTGPRPLAGIAPGIARQHARRPTPAERHIEPCRSLRHRAFCGTLTRTNPRTRGTMPDIIYTMKDLGKVVPPKRQILKGIWLSFWHGAKIGVLGANGAGKSSLLRIMAGVDKDFIGEAFIGKGYSVGFLTQEPQLDPAK